MHVLFLFISAFFIFIKGETHHCRELIASANTHNSVGFYVFILHETVASFTFKSYSFSFRSLKYSETISLGYDIIFKEIGKSNECNVINN